MNRLFHRAAAVLLTALVFMLLAGAGPTAKAVPVVLGRG